MFNTFYKGTVDDLLAFVGTAPKEEIEKVGDENETLNRDELIAYVVDTNKCSREEAERIVTEIQREEFNELIQPMIEKGFVELTGYDASGDPIYKPTVKGLMASYKVN